MSTNTKVITLILTDEQISDLQGIVEIGVDFYHNTEESNPEFWERIVTLADEVDAALTEVSA